MNRRKVVVYLAGKYSGDIHENIAQARAKAIELWNIGYTVICPHLNTIHFEIDCDIEYAEYIKGDQEILRRCDAIFMLEGWEQSSGAVKEYEEAMILGVPIFYDIEGLETWYHGKPTT